MALSFRLSTKKKRNLFRKNEEMKIIINTVDTNDYSINLSKTKKLMTPPIFTIILCLI